jgi:hypothetical protein
MKFIYDRQNMLVLVLAIVLASFLSAIQVLGESGTDFAGTVVMVDVASGKFGVKKEGGGSRFTFVVNEKTQFGGPDLRSLGDVKPGTLVTVNYSVKGSQYIANKVTATGK